MAETQPGAETQEMLNRATHIVAMQYAGDQVIVRVAEPNFKDRHQRWEQAAKVSPAFAGQIRNLRDTLWVVHESKKIVTPPEIDAAKKPFLGIEDQVAGAFLSDVLLSCMIGLSEQREANPVQAMANEMGLQQGWQSEQAKGITLDNAVSAVLQGKLTLPHRS
jgi:hypothetical protein